MIKRILLLSCCFSLGMFACSSPNDSTGNTSGMAPIKLPLPDPALEFDYLLYDNDYNAVPMDEDPSFYTNEVLDSALVGLAYRLTNERAFAPGLFAVVSPDKRPTWYHLNLRVLKASKDMQEPLSARGLVVFSWERGGTITHYSTYTIKDLMKQQKAKW